MRDIERRGHLHNGFRAGEVLRPFNIERSPMKLLVSSIVHDSSRDPADLTADGGDHIIRRQRPPDSLQLELANWLDFDSILNVHQHTGADEDLTRFCFVA